jgi:hypothetical protein
MSVRRLIRTFALAWILGVALAMLPLATALAGGGGTFYPH